MNNSAHLNATDWPIYLTNEATADVAVFDGASPTPTVAVINDSIIVPDSHIPPSGQK